MSKRIDENSSRAELIDALVDVFNMRETLKAFMDFCTMSTEDLYGIYHYETEWADDNHNA